MLLVRGLPDGSPVVGESEALRAPFSAVVGIGGNGRTERFCARCIGVGVRSISGALAAAALALALSRALENDSAWDGDGAEAEEALFARSQGGDGYAREVLVQRYLPLAHRLARRYWYGREPLDDLLQVAGMGLVKAIDRFDSARRLAFPSYAVPTILGELKRYFRDNGWALHVPQRVQARALQVERAADDLRVRLGRTPSAREVAEATGVTVREVVEAAEASNSAAETVSLESPRGAEDAEAFGNSLGSEDERYDLVEYEASIQPALRALPARERLIVHLRFSEDMTQFEIAQVLGISQMHVSRLLRRALARLRAVANSDGNQSA
jgi:RNA polymerase sigma-B factor